MTHFTEEQNALREAVAELADGPVAKRATEIDQKQEFPWDMVELLANHDVLALPFPEQYGGLGGDLISVLLSIEELSRASASVGLILGVHELAALPLLHAGTDEQKQRWVPDLAAGKKLIAFGLTESGAGSDASSLRTKAERDGDGWILNGEKRFISQGDVASLVAIFAVTDTDPKAVKERRHLTCFYVEKGTDGFSAPRNEHKLGIRGTTTSELALKDVRISDDNRVGDLGDGWMLAMKTFERSRPGIAAQAVGIARGAVELAVSYAAQRRQFGKPIGEHQMVAAMLADMASRTEAARELLYAAAERIAAGDPSAPRWAAMAKLFAGDTAMAVTTDAVQVLGGYGYTTEYPAERMMRDAKITQIYEGTQQIQRLIIARDLLTNASRS